MTSFEAVGDRCCLSLCFVDALLEPALLDDWKKEKKCDEAPLPPELDPIENERDGEGTEDADVDLDVGDDGEDADECDEGEVDRDEMRMRNDFFLNLWCWSGGGLLCAGLWVATTLILSKGFPSPLADLARSSGLPAISRD